MDERRLYRWTSLDSQPAIPRTQLVMQVCRTLLDGESIVLLGGHGTGKSYLLEQIVAHLGTEPNTTAVLIDTPAKRTLESCIDQLRQALGQTAEGDDLPTEVAAVVRTWLANNRDRQLVLLYDELDRYVEPAAYGQPLFDGLEKAREKARGRLGVLGAGGIGAVWLQQDIGSAFTAKARWVSMPPFSDDEVSLLAAPMRPLPDEAEVLAVLRALAGGHAALTTYGLRGLLTAQSSERTPARVRDVFLDFLAETRFIQRVAVGLGEGSRRELPSQVWRLLLTEPSPSTLVEIQQRLEDFTPSGLEQALDMLVAAGLVRVSGSVRSGSVAVQVIPSILNVPLGKPGTAPAGDLCAQLQADLSRALVHIHRLSADFYRQGAELVPESVFAATLAITLASAGWEVEREAQQAAGRTDIKATFPAYEGHAVIEVKIWGRNDFEGVHAQVCRYRVDGTAALAVVMLSDRQSSDGWPADYLDKCLDDGARRVDSAAPISAVFELDHATDPWPCLPVHHLLLALPRSVRRQRN